MADRREFAAAVVAIAVGGGLGVLATARTWSTVTVHRLAPLGTVRHDVTGRTLAPAVTGLAVVALAGVLAVFATRGHLRRAVGAVVALAGVGMIGWALGALTPVSDARGRTLVADSRAGLNLGAPAATDVAVRPGWLLVATLAGVVVALGGIATLLHGGRWLAMSGRYDAPVAAPAVGSPPASGREVAPPPASEPEVAPAAPATEAGAASRARADLALWQRLDRGEDPTEPADPTDPADDTEPGPVLAPTPTHEPGGTVPNSR